MAIGWSGLGSALTQGPLDIYKLMLEQRFRQQQAQQSQEMDYQDWTRRQLFLQGLQGPERAKQQAWQQLEAFQQTYPMQQIMGTPALQAQWQQLRTQAGVPLATGPQGPGTMQQVGLPTGTGPGLTHVGTQQPIGPQAQLPILPQVQLQQPQMVAVLNRRTGQVQYVPIQPGARIEPYTPPEGEKPLDPSQLSATDRAVLDLWVNEPKRNALTPETQQALGVRVRAILQRIGFNIPATAPPPTSSGFLDTLRRWLTGAGAGTQPRNITAGVPQPQPAVGTPPVSPGVPAPPARAVGAPPVVPQKTITQAQVAAIAKKKGVPLAEAIRQAKAQGFVVVP